MKTDRPASTESSISGNEEASPSQSPKDQTILDTVNRKRRRADAFGRMQIAANALQQQQQQQQQSKGFTRCPLCGPVSSKWYALGRGIASHLQAIHTPWKPTKLSRKIARRQWEQQNRQRVRGKKNSVPEGSRQDEDLPQQETNEGNETAPFPIPTEYCPSQEVIDAWEAQVSDIVQQVEQEHMSMRTKSNDSKEKHGSETETTTKPQTGTLTATEGKSSKPMVPYKDSLPPFLRAAAQGQRHKLLGFMEAAKTAESNTNPLAELLQETDRHGSAAEHWAAGGGHLDCLKLLLDARAKVLPSSASNQPAAKRRRRRDGKTPLHYAARNGHLECVRYLVEVQKQSIEEMSGEGTTPLHMACYGGHLPVVQYLVDHAARSQLPDPTLATNAWGCTSAHWVAMTLNTNSDQVHELCSYLQNECAVDFGCRQQQGHSALHKAAQRQNQHVLEWMASNDCRLGRNELAAAAAPDQGGHVPSEIWRALGGTQSVAQWMEGKGW